MSGKTEYGVKSPVGIRVRCGVGVVMVTTFVGMVAYETIKELCAPQWTKWQSHWLTIILSTIMASVFAYYALSRQQRADRRLFQLRLLERERAETAIRGADRENERLLTAIPSVLISLDAHGRITKWNHAAEAAFGIDASVAIGKRIDELAIKADCQILKRCVSRCQFDRISVNLDDFPFRRPDGETGFLSISATPIVGEGDASTQGALVLGTDITERRSLAVQLSHAKKLESIGQLAAGIAHEINTPIQYIGDNVKFLCEAFGELQTAANAYRAIVVARQNGKLTTAVVDEAEASVNGADFDYLAREIPEAVRQSLDGVRHVAKIVRAMKDFSHPDCDTKTPIDLNKTIETTIAVARNEWKYVAEVVTQLDPQLPLVPCFPGEFSQVVLNLIVNAAHAIGDRSGNGTNGKGTITISTCRVPEWVEIRVKDTGTGIPEAARSKIFFPFFTTKPIGKGTGQGLAIAHAVIVKMHGGTLTFETEMGIGTTFLIRLPVAEPKVVPVEDPTTQQRRPICIDRTGHQ